MTDKKPKFNTTVCFHCGVDKAVEIAKAFEQGKLAGKKELVVKLEKEIDPDSYVARIFWYPKGGLTTLSLKEWLKSQLKEAKK